jgi:hypothetical protein
MRVCTLASQSVFECLIVNAFSVWRIAKIIGVLHSSAMPRLPQPPHEDPEVERMRQAHRDRRAAKAKTKASAVPPSASPLPAVDQKLLQLRSELAIILEKPEEEVRLIKQKDELYDPVDGLMIMSDKNRNDAAEDLRIICERYADMKEKLLHIQFGGQGNHSNSKGCDLPTLVEIMMLSPSRKGAAIRRLAAVTLCRVLGGDTGLARQILDINRVQEHLKENEIPHPARVYGQYVEEQGSSGSHQHCTRMEDLDYERKKQKLEAERQEREADRQKQQLKFEDEREAEKQKRQLELTEMKDRLEVAQQARRLDLEGEQQKRTIFHVRSLRGSTCLRRLNLKQTFEVHLRRKRSVKKQQTKFSGSSDDFC